ncbi:Chalcone isomerase-like [Pseudomonas pohangensis]|uniref:Chalcone isomerase-like n=1 Tax=Pseudomonas pohangensis TaxID=364197 RepID=A0A1H2GVJ4_9PSED|nr:chalcone isomerase family protein [Pseudomonas pohangensis]SDU23505.1 Chalcone isomerase-like [Pseudomonas pohangensis]
MSTWRNIAGSLLMLLCLGSMVVQASWRTEVPDARVIGQGELSLFGFRIYSARLLGPAAQFDPEKPYALELTYHRAISRDDLVEVSLEQITRQTGINASPEQLRQWQSEMYKAFVDVDSGQQITGVFLPGQGCRFYVGERLQHAIADPLFARAFFAIWLGTDTSEPELREQLLGIR